jgi:hypothetical protein
LEEQRGGTRRPGVMATFKVLTSEDGQKCWVNLDQVTCIRPKVGGSNIFFIEIKDKISVKETPDQVTRGFQAPD